MARNQRPVVHRLFPEHFQHHTDRLRPDRFFIMVDTGKRRLERGEKITAVIHNHRDILRNPQSKGRKMGI